MKKILICFLSKLFIYSVTVCIYSNGMRTEPKRVFGLIKLTDL